LVQNHYEELDGDIVSYAQSKMLLLAKMGWDNSTYIGSDYLLDSFEAPSSIIVGRAPVGPGGPGGEYNDTEAAGCLPFTSCVEFLC
jgi:hypothetical protein